MSLGETATGEASVGTSPAIELRHIWKVFGQGDGNNAIALAQGGVSRADILQQTQQTVAVRDVSFSVARGETFVVMGLSGSGKSTLIRCLARLIEPTSGQVLLGGDDLLAMSNDQLIDVRRGRMSMVFQHFGLFPHRKVIDNIAYGLEVQKINKATRLARATEVLNIVGLDGWANHYPQQLSGGMQQRVGLARALAVDPQILLFDEPFSALDPLIRKEMQDELIRLQKTMQRTVVFITHDFAEALRLGDRIAIMKDGSFDQIGTPEEIVANPATPYVREFVNDVPRAKVLSVKTVTVEGQAVSGGRTVVSTAKIETIIPMLLERDEPITVVDASNHVIGVVNRHSVAAILQAEQQ
ncbi:MAG: glycine betaine/L-proline ABC transporter ATP-binding protein [Actinomycetota bacterium]